MENLNQMLTMARNYLLIGQRVCFPDADWLSSPIWSFSYSSFQIYFPTVEEFQKQKRKKKKKKKKKERKKEEEQEKGAGRRSWRVSMSLFTATSGEVIPQLHF